MLRQPQFWAGLLLVLLYCWSVKYPGAVPGYAGDYCSGLSTQALQEKLSFRVDGFVAPYGLDAPFFPWFLERDAFGALLWSPELPVYWFFFCASLLLSFVFASAAFSRLRIPLLFAAATVLFQVPRHLVLWHEPSYYALGHWFLAGVFFDLVQLKRAQEGARPILELELWRLILLGAGFWLAGYYWGPLLIEFFLGRIFLWTRFRPEIRSSRTLILPGILLSLVTAVNLFWFGSLWLILPAEKITQPLGWNVGLIELFQPLWWSTGANGASIGWFWWLPAFLALCIGLKRRSKLAYLFGSLLLLAIMHMLHVPLFSSAIRYFPFMDFFRNSSRWSLLLPMFCAALWAGHFEELKSWILARGWRKLVFALFLVSSLVEARSLLSATDFQPDLPGETKKFLAEVKELPGKAVLDLPFCMTGANDACAEQCPYGFESNVGQCFRQRHGKSVYGIYAGRLVESDCRIYGNAPYSSWFRAWKEERCFTGEEWEEFCRYLGSRPETAAVLVYPDLWKAAGESACVSELERRLGPPLARAEYPQSHETKARVSGTGRVWRFAPRCR